MSKVCHTATKCHHWTTLGVPSPDVNDGLPFDPVTLSRKQEASKVGLRSFVRTHGCGVESLMQNKELDALEKKGVMHNVVTPEAILS